MFDLSFSPLRKRRHGTECAVLIVFVAMAIAVGANLLGNDLSVLSIEPDRRQVLVDELARADLPALDIGAIRHDPIPPQYADLVRLGVQHVFFEVANQVPLLGEIGLAQHPLVEIDFPLVLILPVIRCGDRGRQNLLHIERWIDHAVPIGVEGHLEIALAHCLDPGTGRDDTLRHVEPDFAPLVDQPGRDIFVGLVDLAVQQLEAEAIGPRLL